MLKDLDNGEWHLLNDFNIIDPTKKGTLILSYFRSGTHFLHDVIGTNCAKATVTHYEICNDDTIQQLVAITDQDDTNYHVCILNNTVAKFYLRKANRLLSKWHTIRLTRNNKIGHFISYWFWELNTLEQRCNNTGRFLHNSTPANRYKKYLQEGPVEVDINVVAAWLQEQLILELINTDVEIDYDDLAKFSNVNIEWSPNHYGDINLSDMFVNHAQVEDLLSSAKPSKINPC